MLVAGVSFFFDAFFSMLLKTVGHLLAAIFLNYPVIFLS